MAIPLHPCVIGMSHRIRALESILDYIKGHDKVWFATGREVVDNYLASGATIQGIFARTAWYREIAT